MSGVSGASDRQRLCRIFGIEPVRPWGALSGAAILAIIPWQTWVVGGPIALGIAVLVAEENRKIAKSLREVDAWGFPVDGYRAWLLATTPAFDLELKRDVPIELIVGSCAAIDAAIVVERRGERIARITMRKIELESAPDQPAFFVGDRRRLHEVHARVLAPLHADVGIVAMRMGDRDTLTALVASPRSATVDAAFREQAIAAPPDLQSLVHVGTSNERPPQEALALRVRTDRLLYATGQIPTTAGALTVAIGGLSFVGGIIGAVLGLGGGLGVLIGASAGAIATVFMRGSDRERLKRALARAQEHGFVVEGYDNWLLSGRPLFDIELEKPVPHREVEGMLRATGRRFVMSWIDERVVRVESEPVMHMASQGIKSFWGGDPILLEVVVERVLVPLHKAHGVAAVRMGGYLDRRA